MYNIEFKTNETKVAFRRMASMFGIYLNEEGFWDSQHMREQLQFFAQLCKVGKVRGGDAYSVGNASFGTLKTSRLVDLLLTEDDLTPADESDWDDLWECALALTCQMNWRKLLDVLLVDRSTLQNVGLFHNPGTCALLSKKGKVWTKWECVFATQVMWQVVRKKQKEDKERKHVGKWKNRLLSVLDQGNAITQLGRLDLLKIRYKIDMKLYKFGNDSDFLSEAIVVPTLDLAQVRKYDGRYFSMTVAEWEEYVKDFTYR